MPCTGSQSGVSSWNCRLTVHATVSIASPFVTLAKACQWLQGLKRLKRTDEYRGSQRTFRNAMAYLFASNPDKHLANVFLETEFCIACAFYVRAHCLLQLRITTQSNRVHMPLLFKQSAQTRCSAPCETSLLRATHV